MYLAQSNDHWRHSPDWECDLKKAKIRPAAVQKLAIDNLTTDWSFCSNKHQASHLSQAARPPSLQASKQIVLANTDILTRLGCLPEVENNRKCQIITLEDVVVAYKRLQLLKVDWLRQCYVQCSFESVCLQELDCIKIITIN